MTVANEFDPTRAPAKAVVEKLREAWSLLTGNGLLVDPRVRGLTSAQAEAHEAILRAIELLRSE